MKVTLDLSTLLRDGAITAEEHDRLARLGRRDTGMVLINALIGFGVIAVSAGALLLVPNALTGVVLGGILMAVGLGLILSRRPQWSILANICILVAALLLGTGIILFGQGYVQLTSGFAPTNKPPLSLTASYLIVTALFAAAAALARSSLLAGLTVLMLFAALGGATAYETAYYGLEVTQPLATVLVFAALALIAHLISRRLSHDWERLATIVARVSLFLVNLGFWVGSLWGDDVTWLGHKPAVTISPIAFALGWAIALFGAALWAGWANRRWVLNLAIVFGAIHFYTQWFEHLGATPVTVLAAGIIVLILAVALWRLNRRLPPVAATRVDGEV
jgi:iron complex transport system permease protein